MNPSPFRRRFGFRSKLNSCDSDGIFGVDSKPGVAPQAWTERSDGASSKVQSLNKVQTQGLIQLPLNIDLLGAGADSAAGQRPALCGWSFAVS